MSVSEDEDEARTVRHGIGDMSKKGHQLNMQVAPCVLPLEGAPKSSKSIFMFLARPSSVHGGAHVVYASTTIASPCKLEQEDNTNPDTDTSPQQESEMVLSRTGLQ